MNLARICMQASWGCWSNLTTNYNLWNRYFTVTETLSRVLAVKESWTTNMLLTHFHFFSLCSPVFWVEQSTVSPSFICLLHTGFSRRREGGTGGRGKIGEQFVPTNLDSNCPCYFSANGWSQETEVICSGYQDVVPIGKGAVGFSVGLRHSNLTLILC